MNDLIHHRGERGGTPAPFGEVGLLGGPFGTETESSPILNWWLMAMRHKWLVLAICGAALVIGIAKTMTADREYRATARIQIDRSATNVVNFEEVQRDGVNDWEFYETQYRLLESRSLAEKVVDELALDEDEDFLSRGNEDAVAALSEMDGDARRNLAIGMVRGGTAISPITGSSMVDISYVSGSPETSARIANAVSEAFITQNLERRFEASAYARDFLKKRLDATRERLEESEREAAAYARSQGIVMTGGETSGDRGSTLASEQLSRLNDKLTEATAARVEAESDFSNDRGGRAAANALGNVTLTSLRRQRSEFRAELSKLQSDFGPEYPRVKALSAQIEELDAQIERETTMVRQSVSNDLEDRYRQALATERALRSQVDAAKRRLLDQQQDGIRFNILDREVATNRALYEGLLQRYKEVGVAGGIGTNNVSIVDAAQAPGAPSSPSLPLNLAVALVFGLIASAGSVFVLEQLAGSRIRPAEVPKKLGVPLLGSTPRIAEQTEDKNELAELSEAYFSTLTSIQFSTEQGAPRSMLVTSSQKGEGKSTTARAIATDLAGLGARVLLLDADMRSPSVHKMFSMPLEQGTSDYLANRVKLAEVVRPSGIENLSICSGGTIPPNPAQLLSGNRLDQLVEDALEHFDHVVFDGPPVLGLADAPLLANRIGGTLFVVESQRTHAGMARRAVERLAAAQARLIGAIVTKYDERSGGYGYGYGYGYGSQYRYGD